MLSLICKLHFYVFLIICGFSYGLNLRCNGKFAGICQSTVKFSYCDITAGFCKCLPLYTDLDAMCVAKTRAFCDNIGRQCVGLPKSHCSLSHRCSCNAPFVDNGTDCVHMHTKKANFHEPLGVTNRNFNSNVLLTFNNNPATEIAEILRIVENQLQQNVQSNTNSPQIQKILTGNVCSTNFDCQNYKYTYCANGRCECLPNYVTMKNKCYPGLGTKCSPEESCVVSYSMCDERSMCSCDYGYRPLNGRCLPGVGNECMIPLKSPCFNVPNSICNQRSICACIDGYHETQGTCSVKPNTNIVPQNENKTIFGTCSLTKPCTASHAYCNATGFCHCLQGYMKTSSGLCTPLTIHGTSCTSHTVCISADLNAMCSIENRCMCKANFIMVFDRCYPVLNHPCSEELPCAVANSFCSQTKLCKCKEGFLENNGFCDK